MNEAGVEANENGRRRGFVEMPKDNTEDFSGMRADRGDMSGPGESRGE